MPTHPGRNLRSRISSLLIIIGLPAIAALAQPLPALAYTHPGMLSTAADFTRVTTKVNAGAHPWIDSWNILLANSYSSSSYVMKGPVAIVTRTATGGNYPELMDDIAAAYANALRWKISGNTACGNEAVKILNAWGSTLTEVSGDSNEYLASGIYGYEIANAAEIMRSYSGWSASDFTTFKNMMKNVFYPLNHAFLTSHNGACISHYWANWDLCNMASMLSIGILCDDTAKFNEAITYYESGAGNGAAAHVIVDTYNVAGENLGQGQEEGRDQGHSGLDVSLLGAFCQMSYNQGQDMFAYNHEGLLRLCEYFAKYNINTTNTVPYTTYSTCDPVTQTVISSASRGDLRPAWALVYQHYGVLKGLTATYSEKYQTLVAPEGGGGNYGPNSGGFDQLGYGTLLYTQ